MDALHFGMSPSASAYQMPWPTPNHHPFLLSAPLSATTASTSASPFRLPSLSPVALHCPPSPTASTSSLTDDGLSLSGTLSPSLSASSSPTICPALLFNPFGATPGSSPAPSPTAPLHSPHLSLPPWPHATSGRSISRPGSTSRTAAQEALDSASLQLWLRLSTEGVAAREQRTTVVGKGKGVRGRKTKSPRNVAAKGLLMGGKSWLDALAAAERRGGRGRA